MDAWRVQIGTTFPDMSGMRKVKGERIKVKGKRIKVKGKRIKVKG
jgi:hypothetical protein